MVAILISLVALALSVIGLAATGTMALRLRLVRPRPLTGGPDRPEEITLPTAGRRVEEVLGPVIETIVPTPDGPQPLLDRFLLTDGPVLVTSTSCGSCRYLLSESADLLAFGNTRILVAAPTIERGIEFVERDCGLRDVPYQVDLDAERLRAFGVDVFPTVLMIADGVVGPAHIVVTRAHLTAVLGGPGDAVERAPVPATGEGLEV